MKSLADALSAADTAVALTGAGISRPSGIPDFRSEDGLWTEYDQRDFGLPAFRADPGSFWERWLETHDEMLADGVEPNAAHEALATLEAEDHLDAVITQNVDGLHRAAGSESVIALHGRGDRAVCRDCGRRVEIDGPMDRAREGDLPPACEACGSTLKPDTVLFGERLPDDERRRATGLARESDVFLAIGSSLTVEPAASLPMSAADRGATLAVVNAEPTKHDGRADFVFQADVTDVLPALADAA
ncbi:MAG: Sir2 family NAD-dependent protein deacetylase [Halobacteriales archaeon]